ncbi:MAG TPA: methyltransferase domain-containing protein [Terriglobales bacterium]
MPSICNIFGFILIAMLCLESDCIRIKSGTVRIAVDTPGRWCAAHSVRDAEREPFMAVDLRELTENLLRFYDFRDKVVLFVGAGGRQLLDPSAGTRKLIAIDQDEEALNQLKSNIAEKEWQDCMEVIASNFDDVTLSADVVYFEFCLHEMDDPHKSLTHARTLAPDTVVYDHSPGSEWIFYGAEEDNVRDSAAAMQSFGIRRRQAFHAEQRFRDHAELLARIAGQGDLAIQRIQHLAGAADIAIPMDYEVVLL